MAAENALKSKAVENNFGSSVSSLAISRVRTLFIPRSEKRDIRPKIDKAAEYVPKSEAPILPARKIA